jgi:hypothetical protein
MATTGFPIVVPINPITRVIQIGINKIRKADLPELLVIINSLLFVRPKKQIKLPSITIRGNVSKRCIGDLIKAFLIPKRELRPLEDIDTI